MWEEENIMEKIPITEAKKWAEKILMIDLKTRSDTLEQIEAAGYEINSQIKNIYEY